MGIAGRALSKLLDDEYIRQRKEDAEGLHNAMVDLVHEYQPSVETLLYVLEMLKVNLLLRERGQPQAQAEPSPGATATAVGWRAEVEKRKAADGGRMEADSP